MSLCMICDDKIKEMLMSLMVFNGFGIGNLLVLNGESSVNSFCGSIEPIADEKIEKL